MYGPRTSIIIYNVTTKSLEQYELRVTEDDSESWERSKDTIKVSKTTRIFSPSNSKAILDNLAYREVLEFWTKGGYNLRYSGSLSADSFFILDKGEGLYCSIGSKLQKKKLRILYECAPTAFLIEKAGGLSSNGEVSILDVIVEGYYQKTDFIVGSKEEVERMQRYLKAYKEQKREMKGGITNKKYKV